MYSATTWLWALLLTLSASVGLTTGPSSAYSVGDAAGEAPDVERELPVAVAASEAWIAAEAVGD